MWRGGWGGVGERKKSEERQRGEMRELRADMGRLEEKMMQNMRHEFWFFSFKL